MRVVLCGDILFSSRNLAKHLSPVLCGDYYIPDLKLPEERCSIGRWGRMRWEYIKEHSQTLYNNLFLPGKL